MEFAWSIPTGIVGLRGSGGGAIGGQVHETSLAGGRCHELLHLQRGFAH